MAPPLSLDTVDDLVKLASIEGAMTSSELRRVVQMLLYGKGIPTGSIIETSTISKQTNDSSTKDTTSVSMEKNGSSTNDATPVSKKADV